MLVCHLEFGFSFDSLNETHVPALPSFSVTLSALLQHPSNTVQPAAPRHWDEGWSCAYPSLYVRFFLLLHPVTLEDTRLGEIVIDFYFETPQKIKQAVEPLASPAHLNGKRGILQMLGHKQVNTEPWSITLSFIMTCYDNVQLRAGKRQMHGCWYRTREF